MESQLDDDEQCCGDCDYELVQDIQGRMILHWNYRNLREIPNEVLDHGEHIEEIYMKRNCLEKLPANIGKLCNLTNLYLVGNQLEELPMEIGNLKCLKVLDLSQNYIRKLPATLGELTLLESFLITYNQLEELPKCFAHLHRLKQLEVSGNRICRLPSDVIDGLQALEEFGIDRNPISAIPRNICLLRNLRYFSACRCNLLLLPSLPFHSLFHSSRTTSRPLRAAAPPQSNAGSLNNCNNNNRNLQFLFDGNPRLNWIPYWIIQLLGSSVECFGCGLDPGESDNGGGGGGGGGPNPFSSHETTSADTQLQLYTYWSGVNRPKIKVNFKGKRRTLHFDEDIVKLHHHHHCGFNRNCNNVEDGAAASASAAATVKVTVASLLELCLRQVHQLGILEETSQKKYGAKPVIEPLIVPQRAGNSLINIRGDLEKKDDEAIQKVALPINEGESKSSDSSSSALLVLPSTSTTSLVCAEMSVKSGGEKENVGGEMACAAQHDDSSASKEFCTDTNNHSSSIEETGSTTLKRSQSQQQKNQSDTEPMEDALDLILPFNLRKILIAGPVAKCFECMKPVFTETWPVIFHIPGWVFDENVRERMRARGGAGAAAGENDIQGDWDDMLDGKLSIGCTHFCSAACVMRFRNGSNFASNLVMNDLRCIVENELQWVTT